MGASILLVDDDRGFSAMAVTSLTAEGFDVTPARSLHEARQRASAAAPDVVVLDRRLPDGDGLDFITEVRKIARDPAVVLVTAHGDISSAVEAVRRGAVDYLTKPVDLAELALRLRRAADELRVAARLRRAEATLSDLRRMVAPASGAMNAVLSMLARIASSSRAAVLLLGETGVGKEVLARHLHALSGGEQAPFIQVNCAALPETTVESELFGHERGAFTDAREPRRGLVELADGGTLFLDEVGELPLPLQAKLLTFLDGGRYRRLGGERDRMSRARVVAATNRDLRVEAEQGRFRQDLWYRLEVFSVDIPPLRQRPEDILPLADGLLHNLADELGRKHVSLSPAARRRLEAYSFPGNVRELKSLLERALVLEPGPELDLPNLEVRQPARAERKGQAEGSGSFVVTDGPLTLAELGRRYARHVLDQLGGRRLEAARALGLSYPTFLKRITGDTEGGAAADDDLPSDGDR